MGLMAGPLDANAGPTYMQATGDERTLRYGYGCYWGRGQW